jgi:ribonuclease HI
VCVLFGSDVLSDVHRSQTCILIPGSRASIAIILGCCCANNEVYGDYALNFDGAARRNPYGPAGCGWVVYDLDCYGQNNSIVREGKRYLGEGVSNNQAEYEGLIAGLKYCLKEGIMCDELIIRGDSQIAIEQMKGTYQVRSDRIRPLYEKAEDLLDEMRQYASNIVFQHVSRDENTRADGLASRAIDQRKRN